jgi:thiamine-phosphate pyrophosphorylase
VLRAFVAIFSSPLYVICDSEACRHAGWTLVDFASACLDGGARVLQVRAKGAPSARLLDQTIAIVERATPLGARVLVNDRADIARLAGAAGVHVGQEDLSPAAARMILGDSSLVGRSTHTLEQVHTALSEPISYLAIGPVFSTATKVTGNKTVGIDGVRAVAALATPAAMPVVAIGGVTLDRAREVIESGAAAVAVISDLFTTGDPRARVRAYLDRLSRL